LEKLVDFNKSIYELSKDSPEVIQIMKGLGFSDIDIPGMLNTVGRFMTIKKGAAIKNLDINRIKDSFIQNGYRITE
jgi:hypothetical protein